MHVFHTSLFPRRGRGPHPTGAAVAEYQRRVLRELRRRRVTVTEKHRARILATLLMLARCERIAAADRGLTVREVFARAQRAGGGRARSAIHAAYCTRERMRIGSRAFDGNLDRRGRRPSDAERTRFDRRFLELIGDPRLAVVRALSVRLVWTAVQAEARAAGLAWRSSYSSALRLFHRRLDELGPIQPKLLRRKLA